MRYMQRMLIGLWLAVLPSVALAANIAFDMVPLVNDQPVTTPNPEITVAPGDVVNYEVTAEVTPSDGGTTADSDGLGYFRFDILTDFGVLQDPVIGIEDSINDAFSFLRKLGTPTDDDILFVRAAQNALSGQILITGVGQNGPQVIVGGQLLTPITDGTYHVTVGGTVEASAFLPGTSTLEYGTVTTGPGFTIQVVTPGSGGDQTNTGGTDSDNHQVDVTPAQDTTTSTTSTSPLQALTLGGIALGLGTFAAWAFLSWAPMAGVVGFVLALATALAWAATSATSG